MEEFLVRLPLLRVVRAVDGGDKRDDVSKSRVDIFLHQFYCVSRNFVTLLNIFSTSYEFQ